MDKYLTLSSVAIIAISSMLLSCSPKNEPTSPNRKVSSIESYSDLDKCWNKNGKFFGRVIEIKIGDDSLLLPNSINCKISIGNKGYVDFIKKTDLIFLLSVDGEFFANFCRSSSSRFAMYVDHTKRDFNGANVYQVVGSAHINNIGSRSILHIDNIESCKLVSRDASSLNL